MRTTKNVLAWAAGHAVIGVDTSRSTSLSWLHQFQLIFEIPTSCSRASLFIELLLFPAIHPLCLSLSLSSQSQAHLVSSILQSTRSLRWPPSTFAAHLRSSSVVSHRFGPHLLCAPFSSPLPSVAINVAAHYPHLHSLSRPCITPLHHTSTTVLLIPFRQFLLTTAA